MPSPKYQKHEEELKKSLSSYDPIERLKARLMEEYQDKSLEDLGGEEIETPHGNTLQITNREKIKFNLKSQKNVEKSIKCDFKLLPGIGDSTATRLKGEGYKTLEDLIEHPRFGKNAQIFLERMGEGNSCDIIDLVKNRYPASHKRVLECAGFKEPEHFIFLDIETMGLSSVPVILMGEATLENNKIEVRQYLLRDLAEEPAVLSAFTSQVHEDTAFVSFNGVTFDLPYIKNRLRHFSIKPDLDRPHFDLLHFSRRFWRENLPNCQLTTIEEHLFDIERTDDVPGSHIPGYYKTYLKTNNIGPLVPIIEHNRMDIVTLALIMSRMHDEL
ncbi:MAG TPA: ribonuclease H-like domain-containing protein [Methanobacteriaceae archaeon]|nr:ribonuclease H-like domain-containing protein [Methanobacteriaceae archaeon]